MESLTELYCAVDEFYKVFEPEWKKKLLADYPLGRNRACNLSMSEIMTLVILFHQVRFRHFKLFYLHLCRFFRKEFPRLPSYNRMIEIMPRCTVPLIGFFHTVKGQCTGISIVDSTPLAVCDNLRIYRHRVFKRYAGRGKSSTGWFYGFKLHMSINHLGEIISIRFTPGNVDDRVPVIDLSKGMFGILMADKGYLSHELKNSLLKHGINFITKTRKNMKKVEHTPFEKAVLRKRSLIETVFDELKNLCQIEHTRHRSRFNFIVNLLSGIIAYCLRPGKPSMGAEVHLSSSINP